MISMKKVSNLLKEVGDLGTEKGVRDSGCRGMLITPVIVLKICPMLKSCLVHPREFRLHQRPTEQAGGVKEHLLSLDHLVPEDKPSDSGQPVGGRRTEAGKGVERGLDRVEDKKGLDIESDRVEEGDEITSDAFILLLRLDICLPSPTTRNTPHPATCSPTAQPWSYLTHAFTHSPTAHALQEPQVQHHVLSSG
jgi:hypothetical protein